MVLMLLIGRTCYAGLCGEKSPMVGSGGQGSSCPQRKTEGPGRRAPPRGRAGDPGRAGGPVPTSYQCPEHMVPVHATKCHSHQCIIHVPMCQSVPALISS